MLIPWSQFCIRHVYYWRGKKFVVKWSGVGSYVAATQEQT